MKREYRKGWIQELCAEWSRKLPLTQGGYAETVRADWSEGPSPERTMLAQARTAYTFTHAAFPGNPALAEAGKSAVERMMKLFWVPVLGGWIRSCDTDGDPVDMTVDTYDQPFGLLALAWNYRATGNEGSRNTALRALDGLKSECTDLKHGGFMERRNGSIGSRMTAGYHRFRRQNPHMHLLEGFLAWHAVDPGGPWLAEAGEMISLFRNRFCVPPQGALAEYFDDGWRPDPGEHGKIREPGHHYEWVWLLRQYREASGDGSVERDAGILYRFASSRGTDAEGFALGAVDDDGNILDGRKLLWPQTEMLKARLAMYEWTGDRKIREAAEHTLSLILNRYFREDGILFYNLLSHDGTPDPAPANTRLLYHLFVAVAEADRVLEA